MAAGSVGHAYETENRTIGAWLTPLSDCAPNERICRAEYE